MPGPFIRTAAGLETTPVSNSSQTYDSESCHRLILALTQGQVVFGAIFNLMIIEPHCFRILYPLHSIPSTQHSLLTLIKKFIPHPHFLFESRVN